MSLFDRVATAPISWGVCEVPGWGHQLSVDRVLSEIRSLGFTHTELGSIGWLPTDPVELARALSVSDLQLLAGFVPLVLHDAEESARVEAAAVESAELLAAAGGQFFNTSPLINWDWAPRRELSEREWDRLFDGLDMVEEICADLGLTQVVHEHVGTAIETDGDVKRVLDGTSVKFVLDTAHLALGGFDPLQFATAFPDRVGLVHLKDMRADLAEAFGDSQGGDDPMTLMAAVRGGLFPALGEGDLPIAEVVQTLEASGYDGWYVIEQDCAITGTMPADGEGPMLDVQRSVTYLQRGCDLNGSAD
jgi:inosose dehydratase